MAFRLTFRKDQEFLQVTAHPDASMENRQTLITEHADPTVFATALGIAGVSTAPESTLAAAAEQAWESPGIEICCEAADLTPGQLNSLGFHSALV
jgi:hypothetical protein